MHGVHQHRGGIGVIHVSISFVCLAVPPRERSHTKHAYTNSASFFIYLFFRRVLLLRVERATEIFWVMMKHIHRIHVLLTK